MSVFVVLEQKHRTDGIGTRRLCQNGSHCSYPRKASHEECISGGRWIYPVCASICDLESNWRTTAQVLYNKYFSVFGFLQRLMSDQGTGFTSKVIQAMCSLLGIEKIRMMPYHPQSNSSAERVHQMLQQMIGKLDLERCWKWLVHLGSVLLAYNATRSLVTGFSPYYLMFSQRPRLSIDLLFPTRREHNLTHTIDEYVKTLYKRLQKSMKLAQDSALKEALWQNWLYDRKVGA